ncbi:MAG: HAD-IA family hydrolase [Deltaproteobacteria bacterium]|nr:HAD-IA family hydrolase [Deltaproteobacteria bacterium]
MTRTARLIVFDLDGTLVDSKDDLASSVNFALAAFGFPALPNPVVYSYVGDGATMLIRRSIPPGENGVVEGVLSTFLSHYSQHLLDTTVPYPGVAEALAAWGDRYRMAVLTNKPVAMTRAILSGLGLASHFAEVRGGDSFETKKPDPAGLLRVMESMGASPRETLMVGDSPNDVLAGRGAGAATCGVTYGLGAAGFAKAPPDFTIDRFPELFTRIRPVA